MAHDQWRLRRSKPALSQLKRNAEDTFFFVSRSTCVGENRSQKAAMEAKQLDLDYRDRTRFSKRPPFERVNSIGRDALSNVLGGQ